VSFKDEMKEAVREVLREELPKLLREARGPAVAPAPPAPGLLSLKQAAAWLGYHPKTVEKWAKAGVLVGDRPGGKNGRWRFELDELKAFKARHAAANDAPATYREKADATLKQIRGGKG
jgi:excisionase family DNA binding protein